MMLHSLETKFKNHDYHNLTPVFARHFFLFIGSNWLNGTTLCQFWNHIYKNCFKRKDKILPVTYIHIHITVNKT